jgi:hypothetical protein
VEFPTVRALVAEVVDATVRGPEQLPLKVQIRVHAGHGMLRSKLKLRKCTGRAQPAVGGRLTCFRMASAIDG